jgi:hypothetical protein
MRFGPGGALRLFRPTATDAQATRGPQSPSANHANQIPCPAMIRAGRRRSWTARGKRPGRMARGRTVASDCGACRASRAARQHLKKAPHPARRFAPRHPLPAARGEGRRVRCPTPIRQNTHTTPLSAPHPIKFHHLFTILSADCASRSRARVRAPFAWEWAVAKGLGNKRFPMTGTTFVTAENRPIHAAAPARPL